MCRTLLWLLLLVAARVPRDSKAGQSTSTWPEEPSCPEACDCHYFRINWVTDCSESGLTAVPDDGLSDDVYILNMNANRLTELRPFRPGIKLRRLQAADNLLTEIPGDAFRGLLYLLDADLSANLIHSVDPNAFRDSPGLITLELQHNRLVSVEGPLLTSQSLMYLDLSDNLLSNLSTASFSNCTALNKLDLSGNPLTSLEVGVFDPLSTLEELKLRSCQLTWIQPGTFSSLIHLHTLEVSGNPLSTVDWPVILGPLARLEMLDLSNCSVSRLPAGTFSNNTWMRTLVLAGNELRDFDVATTLGQNLQHLVSVDLSQCHLSGPLSEDAFANATKLRTLILSGNRLSANDLATALSPLTRLHTLALRDCALAHLPANLFAHMTSLERLDISWNALNNAFTGTLSPLEQLKELDMSHCNLSHIFRGTFSSMSQLTRLVLSGNPLNYLEYGLFHNLTLLRRLELDRCDLTHAPDATIFASHRHYSDLQQLTLSGNPIVISEHEPLLPTQLSNIHLLDISECNISALPGNVFNNTANITELNLSGNPLESDLQFLQMLPHLQVLDVSDCRLQTIRPQDFSHNPNITSLKLTGNPWRCDCNLADLWEWASGVKGDLSILEDATTASIRAGDDPMTNRTQTQTKRKKKKALTCQYDMAAPAGGGRTWARYLKEAHCEGGRQRRAGRYLTMAHYTHQGLPPTSHATPTWIVALACVTMVIFLATIISTALALLLRKARPDDGMDGPLHVGTPPAARTRTRDPP